MRTADGEEGDFQGVLAAEGRSPEIPESADAYGWLVGSWDLEACEYPVEGPVRRSLGEVHFGWVLEGRAVQDVWVVPRRSDRAGDLSKTTNLYGTTLRVWDSSIQAWRVTWVNPVTGSREQLVGRWSGNDVVQVGTRSDGTPIRWIFTEIEPDSFHWLGESLNSDGKTWTLRGEFHARRRVAAGLAG